ncbi:hypothetical protein DFH94DRAFT_677586 [Russula ochroleuca]|nr:hypothetical protein DFH94DRAFT_677586 [Russula ochroleuca]
MSPESPSDNATLPRSHPRKLDNDGNMSLANTVLHSLVYCPPFQDLFRDLPLGQRERGETGGDATPLMDATVRFLDEFAHQEKSSVTHQAARGEVRDDQDGKREDDGAHSFPSTNVYDALKEKRQFTIVRDDWQQDVAVFLKLYLEALDEELVALQSSISKHKPGSTLKAEELEEETQSSEGQTEMGQRDYTASSIESPISRIFGGRSRSVIRAPNQPDTTTVEDWRLLQLDIQFDSVHTVEDALTHISQPQRASQPVQVGQLSSSDVSQQVQIEALPPVLVLHLKRFLYDATADGVVKISKPVKFAPELEIPLEIMAPAAGKSVEPAHYKLYGVVYHHGESASGGHYTVDVLHSNGDSGSGEGWLHIGEGAVSVVRHEDVFEGHDNEQMDNQCAYMLIYCRIAPNQI